MPRDLVRDAVRGLTCLEMTFVNASGLAWTAHSGYTGQITYADTIFPCFAFLAGMSPAPVRRNVGLIGLGLGLNSLGALIRNATADKENKQSALSLLSSLRIPGVLQRLGLAGLLANARCLAWLQRAHGLPLVALWYAVSLGAASEENARAGQYWGGEAAGAASSSSSSAGSAQTRIDTALFGSRHLHTPSVDPEGALGALTTAVTMLAGRWLEEAATRSSSMGWEVAVSPAVAAAVAVAAVAAGETLHYALPRFAPLSKSLWTPSFVLVTSGVSALKILAMRHVVLPRHWLPAAASRLLETVGQRSLESYVLSSVLMMLLRIPVPVGKNSTGESRRAETIFARIQRFIAQWTGPAAADALACLGVVSAVAAGAQIMVAQNWRLRW